MEPHQIKALLKFGDQAKKEGNRKAALKMYQRAAQTGSVGATVRFANNSWIDGPESATFALEALKPGNPLEELEVSRALVVLKGWNRRLAAGKMYEHAESVNALGFEQDQPEWDRYREAGRSAKSEGFLDQTMVAYHEGNRQTYRYSLYKNHIMGTLDWDHPLQTAISGTDSNTSKDAAIWLACDQKYTPFANPLIKSLKHHGVTPEFYLFDDHKRGALYYHAARFIRLHEWMEANNRPVWLLDVDALCQTRPDQGLFPLLDGFDVALRGRPCRLEPWNQLNACVVGFNNTPNGRAYLRAIAEYIQRALDRDNLQWGIDQVAMLCAAHEGRNLLVKWLGDKAVDYTYQDEGVIWCNSGANKWRHLQPGCVDPDRQRYVDKFLEWTK